MIKSLIFFYYRLLQFLNELVIECLCEFYYFFHFLTVMLKGEEFFKEGCVLGF